MISGKIHVSPYPQSKNPKYASGNININTKLYNRLGIVYMYKPLPGQTKNVFYLKKNVIIYDSY